MTFHSFSSIIYPSKDYDYIGNESCIDLQTQDNFLSNNFHKSLASSNEKKMKSYIRNREKKREFPPPIPCLAQTQNLASHMPYVLKKYYTNEGRLIIKEEKVKHHEYFHAHRENGRLTLHLVTLDNDNDDEEEDYFMQAEDQEEEEQEEEEINNVTMDQNVAMNGDFEEENVDVGDEFVVDEKENENEIVRDANNEGNYLNCNTSLISSHSGIFGVLSQQPIRTV